MSLLVTRATINEVRRVAINRKADIELVAGRIPAELTNRSRDHFLHAFLNTRELDSATTVERFFERFDTISDFLKARNVELDDRIESELIPAGTFPQERAAIMRAASENRPWPKGESAVEHDLFHLKLVEHARSGGRRSWFLTRDRTLEIAAAHISVSAQRG